MSDLIQHRLAVSGGQIEYFYHPPIPVEHRTPLLFLHGILSSGRIFTHHYLPGLAALGHPTYAMSLRGFGESKTLSANRATEMQTHVNDVIAMVDHIRCTQGQIPILIGYSLGGLIAQHTAAALHVRGQTSKLAALGLLASVPPQGFVRLNQDMLLREPLVAFLLGQAMTLPHFAATNPYIRKGLINSLFYQPPSLAQIDALFESVQYDDLSLYLQPHEVDTQFCSALPVFVMGASHDKLVSTSLVNQTASAYQTTPHFFTQTGHAIPLETYWQENVRQISDLINFL
uniref:alpha/beta hydrolase n=1 Tax=Thaumasiovibrio occultus TaxID=1891184 RepID=UPI000B35624E|nr:alpha/beta fold hydrolase [Thaumasiovibrio occultus]